MTQFKSYLDNEIEALQAGSSIQRFGQIGVSTGPGNFTGPSAIVPIGGNQTQSTPTTVATGVPITVGAGNEVCGSLLFSSPATGSDVSIPYAELTVTNAGGTQVLSVCTEVPVSVASGNSHDFQLNEMTGSNQVTGSDLVMQSNGSIKSTAGGSFFVQAVVQVT